MFCASELACFSEPTPKADADGAFVRKEKDGFCVCCVVSWSALKADCAAGGADMSGRSWASKASF